MEARQGGGGGGRGGGGGKARGGGLCSLTRTSALFLWRWGPTKLRAPDRSDPFSPSRMCTPCCLSQVRRAVLILCPVFDPVGGCRWFRLGVRTQLCAKSNYPAVLTVLSPHRYLQPRHWQLISTYVCRQMGSRTRTSVCSGCRKNKFSVVAAGRQRD